MFMKHYAPNRCEPSIEALNFEGGGGDQGRCERRSEVLEKFQQKKMGRGDRDRDRDRVRGGGGQVRGGGVRVDVNREVKVL